MKKKVSHISKTEGHFTPRSSPRWVFRTRDFKVCQSEAEEAALASSWKVIHSHRGVEDKEAAAALLREKNLSAWLEQKQKEEEMSFWKLLLTGDEKVDEKTLGGFGRDLAFVGALVAGTNSSDN